MMTSPISTMLQPTIIDQTDRDPHRRRDDEANRHHHHARPHPHVDAPAETAPAADEHKTIGLLLDVRA